MSEKLLLGDCMELMKEIPDGSVDMVLCDLPYGKTRNKWDKVIPFEPLWEEYHRIAKDNAAFVLFGTEPFASDLRKSNIKQYKYDWIWNKSQVTGFLNAKKQPLRQHETISVFYKTQCTYNPQMIKGKMQKKHTGGYTTKVTNYDKIPFTPSYINDIYYPKSILFYPQQKFRGGHPTQKPVTLLEYLIRTYTNEGETVLDNCMGSGSTGVACKNTGRNFIGIEIDPEYYRIASERIRETVYQMRISDCG